MKDLQYKAHSPATSALNNKYEIFSQHTNTMNAKSFVVIFVCLYASFFYFFIFKVFI